MRQDKEWKELERRELCLDTYIATKQSNIKQEKNKA